jgi:hypothetical protein
VRRKGTTDWWQVEELVHWVRYHGADNTACGIDCTKDPQPTYCVKPSLKDLTCPKCRDLAATYWDEMATEGYAGIDRTTAPKLAGIKTGRMSASLPNLQNIPQSDPLAPPKHTGDLEADIKRALGRFKGEKATAATRHCMEDAVEGVLAIYVAHGVYSRDQFKIKVNEDGSVEIAVTEDPVYGLGPGALNL